VLGYKIIIKHFFYRYFEDVTEKAGVNMDGAWSDLRNTHNDGTHVFGGSFTVRRKRAF